MFAVPTGLQVRAAWHRVRLLGAWLAVAALCGVAPCVLAPRIAAQTAPTAPAAPVSSPFGQTGTQSTSPSSTTGSPAGRTSPNGAILGQTQPGTQTPADRARQTQTEGQTDAPVEADRRAREAADRASQVGAPSQPTEFQRLVQDSIGVELPIFGASLFSGVPSTFAPVDNIPVAPDYVIGPGDELRIQVYGQVNQQGSFVVDRTGNISFPEVGTIHVAGIQYQQAAAFLKSQLGRVFRNFDLNVNLGQLRSIQVFVVGEARRPGAYTVSSLSTLLNALFASGGPLPQGSLRDIQLIRSDAATVHFDLYDLLLHGDKSKDVTLAPGDVLFIPVSGPQVAISGSVNTAAIFEIRPDTRVSQLIELAGGKTSVATGSAVRLERIFEHTMRSVVDVDLSKGQDPVLAAGDIMTIGSVLNRYADAVTLRGNVTAPGRYVWHQGMRILDLVPSREQLITRDYYSRRNALGTSNTEYQNGQNGPGALRVGGNSNTAATDQSVQSGSASTSTSGGNSVGAALTASNNPFNPVNDIVLSAPDIDWSYAVIERLNSASLTTSLISFNPGALYLRGDTSQNLELLPGDVVTFFSTADLKVPTTQQTRFVRLEGEFNASGLYSVRPGETLRQLIARAGGFTPDAYLYGSEFTRLSTRRVQQQRLAEYADNLDAQVAALSATNNARSTTSQDSAAAAQSASDAQQAIARLRRLVPIGRIVLELKPDSRTIDSLPDLALEDGDRFVVPRVPSTVTVEGQVYSANAFVFQYGQKERNYLRRAGGPDRQADKKRAFILRADGSVFSRQYGDVDRATIFPGDTIVIPPQLQRRAVLRDLLDISTLVGQFGLGAAAVEVLK